MKIDSDQALQFAAAAGITALALFAVLRFAPGAAAAGAGDAVKAVGKATGIDPAGTRYEGAGAVGGVANVANNALGGLPERFGSWIGQRLADLRGF
jgi:hypothetical protein